MENKGQPYIQQQAPPYSPPGQPGWAPQSEPAAPMYQPTTPAYGAQHVIIQQPPQPQQQTVLILGGCPRCRVGHLEDEFTCCGILCCILFFPLGIICLFAMRDKRCSNCGASF